jgi:membrane protein
MPEPVEHADPRARREDREDRRSAEADASSPVDRAHAPGPPPDDGPPPPPPPPRKESDRNVFERFRAYVGMLARGVWRKGEEDQIFFLAGAISFNVLVAFLPLLLTVVGVAGAVLRFQGADAQQTLLGYLDQVVPQAVNLDVEPLIASLAEQATGLLSIGTLFFLWVATRLVGTLRTVLRDIFDLPEGRGIIAGKIFDIKMVLAAGTLFALNIVLTLGLRLSADFVASGLRIDPDNLPFVDLASQLWPQLVAFFTIWAMFFLIYRYLPPRRIKWNTAAIAATFTAVLGEALKFGFSWYVTAVADFRSTWGNIATFIILVIWIYYTALVFILGGEVAQVVSMHRTRRRQKERLA